MKRALFSIISVLSLLSCSTHNNDLTTDKGTMAEGDRLTSDGFYEEGRKQYYRIKTEFPQSTLQVQADLKVAESYYKEESYQAAADAYEAFLKTYPGRPEIPEALYQLGLCYSDQMPKTPQRDTRPTAKVIDTFTRLMVDYPENPHAADAQKRINDARDQLAQKNFQIARFYERQGYYDSAARRFNEFLEQFPSHELYEEAYARLIRDLYRSGQDEKASRIKTEFEEKFPNTKFRSMITK